MGLARACGGVTGRVVQGIAASMKGTAFHGRNVQFPRRRTSGASGRGKRLLSRRAQRFPGRPFLGSVGPNLYRFLFAVLDFREPAAV